MMLQMSGVRRELELWSCRPRLHSYYEKRRNPVVDFSALFLRIRTLLQVVAHRDAEPASADVIGHGKGKENQQKQDARARE